MNYRFILEVKEETSDERVILIDAPTLEMLEEQLRKVEHAIESYEEKQEDYGKDNGKRE